MFALLESIGWLVESLTSHLTHYGHIGDGAGKHMKFSIQPMYVITHLTLDMLLHYLGRHSVDAPMLAACYRYMHQQQQ